MDTVAISLMIIAVIVLSIRCIYLEVKLKECKHNNSLK